jgi:hypothetical protein
VLSFRAVASGKSAGLRGGRKRNPAYVRLLSLEDRRKSPMRIFQVRQLATHAVLWVGAAHDEKEALEAMAREAGYGHFDNLPPGFRNKGLRVERLET